MITNKVYLFDINPRCSQTYKSMHSCLHCHYTCHQCHRGLKSTRQCLKYKERFVWVVICQIHIAYVTILIAYQALLISLYFPWFHPIKIWTKITKYEFDNSFIDNRRNSLLCGKRNDKIFSTYCWVVNWFTYHFKIKSWLKLNHNTALYGKS